MASGEPLDLDAPAQTGLRPSWGAPGQEDWCAVDLDGQPVSWGEAVDRIEWGLCPICGGDLTEVDGWQRCVNRGAKVYDNGRVGQAAVEFRIEPRIIYRLSGEDIRVSAGPFPDPPTWAEILVSLGWSDPNPFPVFSLFGTASGDAGAHDSATDGPGNGSGVDP